jgi:septum formation protein
LPVLPTNFDENLAEALAEAARALSVEAPRRFGATPDSHPGLYHSLMRLILASASPRRAELLVQAGFSFETAAANIDERILVGESPDEYVRRLAIDKAAAVAASAPQNPAAGDLLVLAADTVVVVDGEILGKPRGDSDAAAMLRKLSGRQHDVVTGVSLRLGAVETGRVETTAVWMAALTREELDWYVSTGEGRDKAGAYAIQGLASRFIPRIDGSYSNVVGLPVAVVHELIRNVSNGAFPALHRAPTRTILDRSQSRKSL